MPNRPAKKTKIREIGVTVNYKFVMESIAEGRRYIVLEGSSRSGKTIAILQALIQICLQNPNWVIVCYRKEKEKHRATTIPDFKEVMRDHFDIWDKNNWNASELKYVFPNGAEFKFSAADEEGSHGAKRQVAWHNEVMEQRDKKAFDQIDLRTTEFILVDYNPSLNSHWLFKQVLSIDDGSMAYQHSTYKDNPFLPENIVNVLGSYDPDNPDNVRKGTASRRMHDIYVLGKRTSLAGAVFRNVKQVHNWPDRYACERYAYAIDYGSVDPTALIEMALHNGELYVRQLIYESNLVAGINNIDPTIPSIQGRMQELEISKQLRIHAESARPEITQVLNVAGYSTVTTKKNADSIMEGINLLQSYKINVYKSDDLLSELESYVWHEINGVFQDKPDPYCADHCIDAMRYWALGEMKNHIVSQNTSPLTVRNLARPRSGAPRR